MADEFGTPQGVWKAAARAIPSLKYALGIGGIAALIAIVSWFAGFKMSLGVAVLGTVVMFSMMTLLVVFVRLVRQPKSAFEAPARVLIWFALVMMMVITVALFTSAFGNWPLHWQHLLVSEKAENGSGQASLQNAPHQQPTVTVTTSNRIVGRIYSLVRQPAGTSVRTITAPFSFQQIFYEWSAVLKADHPSVASLKVDSLKENDSYRVDPEGASVQIVSESPLGFKEPHAETFTRSLIVKCDDLSEAQPLTVTVRRLLTVDPLVSDLIKLAYVRSTTGKVDQLPHDPDATVQQLETQMKAIVEWKYAPRTSGLPIHPPGKVPPGFMQTFVEMRCKDELCETLLMNNLVAEWNRIKPSTTEKHEQPDEHSAKVSVNVLKKPQGNQPAITTPNQSGKDNIQTGPIAIAPNGIANAAPNFGNQTVNNAPPARRLPADRTAFISCLKLKPGRFSISALANNQEAYDYAQDWHDMFLAAGWEIEHKDIPIQIFMIGGGMWSGMRINMHAAAPNGVEIADSSPEKQFYGCLTTVPLGAAGTIIPYNDIPTGVVRILISSRQ